MTPDLSHLPHEDFCNLGSTHADCCPSKAEFGCSCITREVVEAMASPSKVEAAMRKVGLTELWSDPSQVAARLAEALREGSEK